MASVHIHPQSPGRTIDESLAARPRASLCFVDDGSQESDADRWLYVKGKYVVLSLVERAADTIIAVQRSKSGVSLADTLYSFDSFRAKYASSALADAILSDVDLRVVIKYLERDRKLIAVDQDVRRVTSFCQC